MILQALHAREAEINSGFWRGGRGVGGLLGLSTDLTYFLHKKYEHEKVTSTGHGRATDGKKRYTHFERFKSINVQYSDG